MSTPRRVLITGAGSGLGQALALRYAAAGDRVACVDLSVERSEATRARLAGSGHLALAADVGSDEDMDRLHGPVDAAWGGEKPRTAAIRREIVVRAYPCSCSHAAW